MMNRCKKIAFACLLAAPLTMLPVEAATVGTPCLALVSDEKAETSKFLEPSGMVWDGKSTLYIVSDNGQIVSMPVADPWTTDPTQWTVLYQWVKGKDSRDKDKAANDFESVARVPGRDDFLYVGVEGDDCSKCAGSTIKEFSISGKKFTDKSWLLRGKNMEAMTFVPDAAADPEGFKGYFLTAAQNSAKLRRYDLNLKDGKTVTEKTAPAFTPALGSATSDFQFSPGNSVFYVLYDADQTKDFGTQRLDQYTKSGDAFGGHVSTNLPYGPGTEAVADVLKDGKVDIYVGVDMSTRQKPTDKAPNRVDLYAPFPGNANCPCAAITSCDLLKGQTTCGWCASLHRALPGAESGPTKGSCSNWIWNPKDCGN